MESTVFPVQGTGTLRIELNSGNGPLFCIPQRSGFHRIRPSVCCRKASDRGGSTETRCWKAGGIRECLLKAVERWKHHTGF